MFLLLAGCPYTPGGTPGDGAPPDSPPDSPPPITCGDLQCDGNADCDPSGPTCSCKAGFTGDGMTCTDIDECAAANGGCVSICVNTPGTFTCATPTSCADVKALVPNAADGDFTLFIEGDPQKPWVAYCAQMAGTPVEYLTRPATSMYNAGGASPGTDVITTYSRLRIRLAPLGIVIVDRLFADSVGMINHSGDNMMVTSMPVGVAMDCQGNNQDTGTASIDLRDTPFRMAAAAFDEGGNMPGSSISLTDDNRRLAITGGGNCGWFGPVDANMNPFNDNAANVVLAISYQP